MNRKQRRMLDKEVKKQSKQHEIKRNNYLLKKKQSLYDTLLLYRL